MSAEAGFRLAFGVILAANLLVSGYFRRRARHATGRIRRSEEPSHLIALRLVFVLLLLYLLLAYLFAPDWIAWSRLSLPEGLRRFGVILAGATLPLNVWILSSLGANVSETVLVKEEHRLVETGPYRWVRHPLYASGILLVAALGLIASSWALLALAPLFALLVRLVIVPCEERQLVERFGRRYEAYRRRTGALLPRSG